MFLLSNMFSHLITALNTGGWRFVNLKQRKGTFGLNVFKRTCVTGVFPRCRLTFSFQQGLPHVQLPEASEASAVVIRRNHGFLFFCSSRSITRTENQQQQQGDIHGETHQTAAGTPNHDVMSTDEEPQSSVQEVWALPPSLLIPSTHTSCFYLLFLHWHSEILDWTHSLSVTYQESCQQQPEQTSCSLKLKTAAPLCSNQHDFCQGQPAATVHFTVQPLQHAERFSQVNPDVTVSPAHINMFSCRPIRPVTGERHAKCLFVSQSGR